MKNHKAKGSKGERELVHFFNNNGWGCVRIAGSGSSPFPAPDILAGNASRRIAVECKVTKDRKKYFPQDEIEQLRTFCQSFGAEAWIGLRFPEEPWYFVSVEDLETTGKCYAVSLERAKARGLKGNELIAKESV